MLEARTKRVKVGDTLWYATSLLHITDVLRLFTAVEAVMLMLHSMEQQLVKYPVQAKVYNADRSKSSSIQVVLPNSAKKRWIIPTSHGSFLITPSITMARLIYICSFIYNGLSLNKELLPGPALGPSLICVLLQFRQYTVAINEDIRAILDQVRLLPEDMPLLRFLGGNLRGDDLMSTNGRSCHLTVLVARTAQRLHCKSTSKTIQREMRTSCSQYNSRSLQKTVHRVCHHPSLPSSKWSTARSGSNPLMSPDVSSRTRY